MVFPSLWCFPTSFLVQSTFDLRVALLEKKYQESTGQVVQEVQV